MTWRGTLRCVLDNGLPTPAGTPSPVDADENNLGALEA